MYSVVLMAALTTASASEGFCHGCAPVSHGCGGGCYGGCYGGGCYGGGGLYMGYGGACYGGCYGYSCYGGFGYYDSGSSGWGGGGYGVYGCYGCYGGWSCYGSNYSCYGQGVVVNPFPPPTGVKPMDKAPEKLPEPKKGSEDLSRARVIIDVPAQAKLFIDDQPMVDKSGQRTFVTPPLQVGQTYYYDVKLVVVVDGQEKAETTRVVLRRGDQVTAAFPALQSPGTATAQAGQKP